MSIREKLLDFKRRLSDRKMYSLVIVVIGAVAVWGIIQYKHAASLRQELDNQYNRAFYDMTGYVNNVDVLLAKSLITSTTDKTASILQEAWRQANLAQTNLGQLPISQVVLANTSKFLTQVGDLSFSLNNQNMSGKPLTDEQYKVLEQLSGFSVTLSHSLDDLQNQLSGGRIKWEALANKGTPLFKKTSDAMPIQQFENVDKNFQEYPKLIYDGPFSEHMVSAELKGLTGDQVTTEQAKESVKKFFGSDKVKDIKEIGKNDTGPINTYSYQVTFNNLPEDQTANIDITQKGGHFYWMLYNRAIEPAKLNVDQAKDAARKFLVDQGYKDMVDTYYVKEDSSATINFAYKQGDVVVYSDLIKVKVALDTGEVLGFEAKGYLSAHSKRDIPKPKLTMAQAREKLNKRLQVQGSGQAIIPTEYRTEIYCYEFKGKLNDRDFLVYINAETGVEENILIIIDSENGILTM